MKKKGKVDDLPDDLRCRRTDGRDWRCKQRVLEGKKLCHIHYLQGRRRSMKQKVPDSLKFERSVKKRVHEKEKGIENDAGSSKSRKNISKKKWKRCVSEALDEALRKMKLKRGDLQLELIRGFLNRQLDKKKRRKEKEEDETKLSVETELTRELPNGIMAISQKKLYNVGGDEAVNVKIGAGSGGLDSGLSVFQQQRSFRSKNIEPLPISTIKVVPFADKLRRNKLCHWCLRSNDRNLISCMKCMRFFFCIECIKQRYFEKQEIKVACPVCRGICSCKICQRLNSRETYHKDFYRDKRKVDKIQLLRYLVHMLLPVLKQINHNQRLELEIEEIVAEKPPSAIIQGLQPEISYKTSKFCNNCKTSILDYHRSCSKCSYSLCLSCCWEYCRKSFCGNLKFSEQMQDYLSNDDLRMKIKKIKSSSTVKMEKLPFWSPPSLLNWEACSDGNIYCPPASFGGCNKGILDLKCMFPFSWMIELEVGAEELLKSCHFSENSNVSSCCSTRKETNNRKTGEISPFQKMADRVSFNNNFLYCPTVKDLIVDKVEHFQQHWAKGHPVVIRNVIGRSLSLSWDPVFIFCSFLENMCSKSPHKKQAFGGTSSLDWCEVETGSKKMLMGSFAEETHMNMQNRIMKIKARISSQLFQEQFPRHFDEIIGALPLEEYVHPISGLLNLAVKLPQGSTKPDVGPTVHITVGGPEDFVKTDFLTKLCCESYDVVNILAYATDSTITKEQYTNIKELMKKYKAGGNLQSTSNSTDLKRKSSFRCGESSLKNLKPEKLHSQNGNSKGRISSRNFKERNPCPVNGNVSIEGTESDSETESEASYRFSKGLQRYEESDGECTLMNEMENNTCFSDDEPSMDSSAAQWDIFRKGDVSKVLEYLRKHCNEFNNGYYCKGNEIHTIHDQSFFLDAYHKMRLKEEFDVEPWTLEQHVGEAIIIPAGCPYQVRKLKSCVNVVVGFISPENAAESIRLTDEIHLLPADHKAREKALEVRKMAVHGIKTALEEVQRLTCKE